MSFRQHICLLGSLISLGSGGLIFPAQSSDGANNSLPLQKASSSELSWLVEQPEITTPPALSIAPSLISLNMNTNRESSQEAKRQRLLLLCARFQHHRKSVTWLRSC